MIIDKVLEPAHNHAVETLNIENEWKIRPRTIQALADVIALVAYDYKMVTEMIQVAEPICNRVD